MKLLLFAIVVFALFLPSCSKRAPAIDYDDLDTKALFDLTSDNHVQIRIDAVGMLCFRDDLAELDLQAVPNILIDESAEVRMGGLLLIQKILEDIERPHGTEAKGIIDAVKELTHDSDDRVRMAAEMTLAMADE